MVCAGRTVVLRLGLICATACVSVALAATDPLEGAAANPESSAAPSERFARGFNIADYLAYPSHREAPYFRGPGARVTDAELQRVASLGFTFIRLPVEPGPFLDLPKGEVSRLERRLTSFVRRADAAGLAVLVTGFPRYETARWSTDKILRGSDRNAFRRYGEFLTRLARLLARDKTGSSALELMNEPQEECSRSGDMAWSVLQRRLYKEVRTAAPKLTVVLTGGCWSGVDGLAGLDMAGYDANTLIDVHFYEPFSFTHQGADWSLPALKYLGGLSFPARDTKMSTAREAIARLAVDKHPASRREQRTGYALAMHALRAYLREDADQDTISARFDQIAGWAKRHGLGKNRIVIGEIGALRPSADGEAADDGARARWFGAVRKAAEARGFGWALWGWEPESVFAVFTKGILGPVDPAMAEALGLRDKRAALPLNHPASGSLGARVKGRELAGFLLCNSANLTPSARCEH